MGCGEPTPEETGVDCVDLDGDGFTDCEDCDDTDANTYPGAVERCDGRDNDCDGNITFEGQEGAECAVCAEAGLFSLTQNATNLEPRIRDEIETADCSYSNATRYMFTALDKENGTVTCVYTGRSVAVGSEKPDPNDMNTEHTWPQSQGASSIPAKCDLHHLFPTDSDANQIRADFPLEVVTQNTEWSSGGSKQGQNNQGEEVFEPRDTHKGNAARALLYFSTQYEFPLSSEAIQRYLGWHLNDPVDDDELRRTQEIGRRQGNINPYVLCPILVEQLATPAN